MTISHPASDKPVLFISDLHLDPSRPQLGALFLTLLEQARSQAAALYILGDLFEAWIGDDAVSGDEPPLQGMRALSASGVPLYIMRGNRDFLLGERFAELTGATLLEDPTVIDLHGEPTLLMHGDSLCIDDTEYQQFRAMVHNRQWQQNFLAKSIPERIAMAKAARTESSGRNASIDDYLMDVNQGAVEAAMREHGVHRLIHGHTHRPAVHDFELDGKAAQRIVLGDWYEQGSQLVCLNGKLALQDLPLPTFS
ncbi:UDP-2,3-diacylglucosamine diphosphatase [Alkalilimnicola ehrlichii]|uniref:UDP-2,3-diacylglucosamine hydrolase n=1 Tax=Alkalilimnicola ehrlichii TaxID=351052 RepID=A0A3E0X078_9GAMM|nr:UDP-2,3-diacylglucosamine diphosphatase [Alkalilimnicola ehrlichii]RFA30874.1 UDP-2,3-diacylglucosamine diphosphatase [Alkalilimnicola ehrlichii]RFA38824.1 UDP-2,3-diacylglucosamine diphosphatase [Alkalilimnicola ehrlichii]